MMPDRPELLSLTQSLAEHSAARQRVAAHNTAHADTPGYEARRLPDFAETLQDGGQPLTLASTRAGHIAGGAPTQGAEARIDRSAPAEPNGNTVSIETEMRESAEAGSDHRLALAVYDSALNLMRSTLGRG